jgi:hypothetical protein
MANRLYLQEVGSSFERFWTTTYPEGSEWLLKILNRIKQVPNISTINTRKFNKNPQMRYLNIITKSLDYHHFPFTERFIKLLFYFIILKWFHTYDGDFWISKIILCILCWYEHDNANKILFSSHSIPPKPLQPPLLFMYTFYDEHTRNNKWPHSAFMCCFCYY